MASFSVYRDSCPIVESIPLLDSGGKRVAVKYYSDDWSTIAAKVVYKISIYTKTQKTNARTEGNLFAMALQIAGLYLFVLGFFPVKPALSGVREKKVILTQLP